MGKIKIGYIGLGKMGMNMVLRMQEKEIAVVAYNRSEEPRREAEEQGIVVADSIQKLVEKLPKPRTLWLMVSNDAVDNVLQESLLYLTKGDTVIDGGNSFYKDSIRRARQLAKKGIDFLDVGVSGGPSGARNGACVMVGGEKKVFDKYEMVFKDLSAKVSNNNHSDVLKNIRIRSEKEKIMGAYAHVGKAGAGHFVKMVHNGIEYGMMQAIAEGFAVLKKSDFNLDVREVAELYNNGSVIRSRLVGWLQAAYEKYGADLDEVSGSVAHTGEGEWTVQAAKELGISVPIIEGAFQFRVSSTKNPSYAGRVLSALRNQFGGHNTS